MTWPRRTRSAAHWYGIAGEQAINQYANQEAVRHYSRALELTPAAAVERRYALLLGREGAHNWLGRRDAQLRDIADLETLAALLHDAGRQAEAALRHAAFDLATGRYQEATRIRRAVGGVCGGSGGRAGAGTRPPSVGPLLSGRPAITCAPSPISSGPWSWRVQRRGQVEEAESLYDLGCVAYYQEDFARALVHMAEAATLYAELDDRRGQTVCLSLYAVTLDRTGDNYAAIAPFAQALRLCREAGWRYAEARLLVQSANNYLNLGDLASSRREHEQAIAICREINDREGIATSLDALGLILSFQDRPAEARECYEEALAIHRAMDDPRGQGYVYTHLGYALIQLEEPELAEEALQRAVAVRRSGAEGGLLVDTLAGLALAALLRAAPEDALPYVAEIQAWLAANGATGVEFPVQVYLVCHRVLRAAAAFDAAYGDRLPRHWRPATRCSRSVRPASPTTACAPSSSPTSPITASCSGCGAACDPQPLPGSSPLGRIRGGAR